MEQYYTLQEVMARLNISRDTIMGLIKKGKIPGTIKLSNVFRIPESGIQRFLEAQTVQPRKPFYVPRHSITASVTETRTELTTTTENVYDALGELRDTAVTTEQLEEVKQSVIQLNSDNLEIRFSQVKSLIDQLEGDAAEKQRVLEEYIRFEGARMELGRSDSVITAVLANDKLSFFENGQEVAYISNLTLYVTEIHVLSRFVMGDADNGPFAHTFGEGGTYDFAYEGEV